MSTLISFNSALLVKSHQYLCSLIFESKLSKSIPLESQYHVSWNDMLQYNNIYNCFWMTKHYCNYLEIKRQMNKGLVEVKWVPLTPADSVSFGVRWLRVTPLCRSLHFAGPSTVQVTPLQPPADRCEEMPTLRSCNGNSLNMKID